MPIASSVKLGKNVKIHHPDLVNLYGCSIGENTGIGAFVELQKNVVVGANCKISSHSFLCEGVVIEDGVFIGHSVVFTNDRFPRAVNPDGSMQTEKDWTVIPTRVCAQASIGSGSVILPGVTIGRKAVIGAGSVVTMDIPENAVAFGNPARVQRMLSA
jgi:acetyltransferase-like isoleucine patch superfamily enzyme